MKKIITLLIVISTLFSFASCGKDDYKLSKVEGFSVDKIEYITDDGIWNEYNAYEMVDKYYYEQCEAVYIDIAVTISVPEDFQYAYITCKGGIHSLDATFNKVKPLSFTKTLGSSIMDDGMIKAGKYTITLEDAEFKFYDSVTFDKKTYTAKRSQVDISVSAEVYKFTEDK